MLQDQINLGPSLQSMRVRCYSCKKTGHLINQCNLMHFNPDKERLIKYDDFSHFQERVSFTRKKLEKRRFKTFQPIKISKTFELNMQTCEYDSSDEEIQDDCETKKKVSFFKQTSSKLDNFFSQSSSITEVKQNPVPLFEKTKTKQFVDNSLNNERKSCLLEPKPRISVIPETDVQNKGSRRPSAISRKSGQSIQLQFSKMESPNEREGEISKKELEQKMGESEFGETYVNYKLIDSFEKIENFKNYFPKSNFSRISKRYNKRNPAIRLNKRKIQDLKKYSQFTFSAEKMFSEFRKRTDMKSSHKNATIKSKMTEKGHSKRETPKIDNFVKLVSNIMRNQKEKSLRNKWYIPFLKLLKRLK